MNLGPGWNFSFGALWPLGAARWQERARRSCDGGAAYARSETLGMQLGGDRAPFAEAGGLGARRRAEDGGADRADGVVDDAEADTGPGREHVEPGLQLA